MVDTAKGRQAWANAWKYNPTQRYVKIQILKARRCRWKNVLLAGIRNVYRDLKHQLNTAYSMLFWSIAVTLLWRGRSGSFTGKGHTIYDIYASMCEVPRSEQCAINTEEPSIWSRDGRCRECRVTSATFKFSWKLSGVWRVDMDCRCMLI